jgi:hypothetical protein
MAPPDSSESNSFPNSVPSDSEPPTGGDHLSLSRSRRTHIASDDPNNLPPENPIGAYKIGGDAVVLDRSNNIFNFGASGYAINPQPYPRSAEYLLTLSGTSQQQEPRIFKKLPQTLSQSQSEGLAGFLESNGWIGHHKGITKYHGLGHVDGRFYLIRDKSSRRCLMDVLDSAPFSDRAVESLVIQIAQNLGSQQPHGAIHPGNIFVDMTRVSSQELRFGTVELTDYFIDQIKNHLASLN